MIDLTKKALPNTVTVGGKAYSIDTDFRKWLAFEIDRAWNPPPYAVGYLFKGPMPPECSVEELMEFAAPQDELPRSTPGENILFDFKLDADFILAAFWGQYHIDLTQADLHWHVFLALFKGLNDSTRMREIMGYRAYDKSEKNVDQYERLKAAWMIERKSQEELEAENAFLARFK